MNRIPSLKKFIPYGLFGRTVLIIMLPILLLQITTTYIFFDRHWTRMTSRLAFAVAGEIASISDLIEAAPKDNIEHLNIVKSMFSRHLEILITFTPDMEQSGLRTTAKDGPSLDRTLARAVVSQVRRPYAVNVDLDRKRVMVDVQLANGFLQTSMPQKRMYDSSGYVFLLWLNGLALVFFLISIAFMRNQIRPIRRLAIAAERFGKGADVQAFKPTGASEIRRATEAFFSMKERITRSISQRTAMLAGVSHDLRTPLTRMKLQLAMMGDTPDTHALKDDLADMEVMLEGYLSFMRGEGDEPTQTINLTSLVARIKNGAAREGFPVTLSAPENLNVEVRPVAFERALSNIVGNAKKYASSADITLWADSKNGWVGVAIDDDGPGISPEHYDDVFKPFNRLETSRNQKTGGIGLGMAIAQDIVLGHGGRIFLDQSPHGGLRVIVHIPL